jgi:hypothetical protein
MTRQEKLNEVGNMTMLDSMSYFIISLPHNFYKNKISIFDSIKSSGWEVINSDSRQLGTFNIKQYIYENMLGPIDESSFIDDRSTLLLRKKIEAKSRLLDYDFIIKEIDLWIFEEHIAFFVIRPEVVDIEKYTIDKFSDFNRLFRNFKFLELDVGDTLNFIPTKVQEGEREDFLKYLLDLTKVDDKSFLKISSKECIETRVNNKPNGLYPIYRTSANAKLMVGVQTEKTVFADGSEISSLIKSSLSEEAESNLSELGILEEAPFYIASCISMVPTKSFTSNPKYVFDLIEQGGFRVWKYASGITLFDSFALLGLEKDGGPVVTNMKNQFYFVYMLNLYVNYQVRFIENKLIDKNFESHEINYWYQKLQKLKNQFVSDEIATKFQENEINKSINCGLDSNKMINEVSENLVETKEITQSNTGVYLTLVGFIFVSILQEPIEEFVSQYTIPLIVIGVPTVVFLFKFRVKIRNLFKL